MTSQTFDYEARLRSFEIVAEAENTLRLDGLQAEALAVTD